MTKDETIEPSLAESRSGKLADLIALLGVASCTCLTKSPDAHMHDASCRYREIMEIADAVEALSDSVVPTGGVSSPDYVMVPNCSWALGKMMCDALFGRWELVAEQDKYIPAAERMLSVLIAAIRARPEPDNCPKPWLCDEAQTCQGKCITAAPPSPADMRAFAASDEACMKYPGIDQQPLRQAFMDGAAAAAPRSDEGSGLTPSKHGFSAAAASKSREAMAIEVGCILAVIEAAHEVCMAAEKADDGSAPVEHLDNLHEALTDLEVVDGMGLGPVYSAREIIRSRLLLAAASEGASPEAVNPAALRAQVIEECAKVADAERKKWMDRCLKAVMPDARAMFDVGQAACANVAEDIRSLSAVSAIAQERDVGEPVAWLRWNSYFHASPHGQDAEGTEALELCEPVDRNAFPVYLHPTTSPSAISEAPTSAEAVKSDLEYGAQCTDNGFLDAVKASPEVGEMVERLTTWANDDVRETARDGSIEPNDIEVWARMMEEAASLLIALDAERGRLREAVDRALLTLKRASDNLEGEGKDHVQYAQSMIEVVTIDLRSALPASDEG